jgi:hypothetical protein
MQLDVGEHSTISAAEASSAAKVCSSSVCPAVKSDRRMIIDCKFYSSGGVTSGIDMWVRAVASAGSYLVCSWILRPASSPAMSGSNSS